MKIPEEPWIVLAAERYIDLERAHNARRSQWSPGAGRRRTANGTAEHAAYQDALRGAFASEGLTPHGEPAGNPGSGNSHPALDQYGTEKERDDVRFRVLMTAVSLLIQQTDG